MQTYIGTYRDMINRAVELILAAAETKSGDAINRIYAAARDVDMKIGKAMEEKL